MATPFLLRGSALRTSAVPGLNGKRTPNASANASSPHATSSLLPPLRKNKLNGLFVGNGSINPSNSLLLGVSLKSKLTLVSASNDSAPDSSFQVPEIEVLPDLGTPEPQFSVSSLSEDIQDAVSEAGKSISDAFTNNVVESVKDTLDNVQDVFSETVENFTDSTSNIVDFAAESFDSLQKEASNVTSSALDFIQDTIDDVKETFNPNADGSEIAGVPSESSSLISSDETVESALTPVSEAVRDDATTSILSFPTDSPSPSVDIVDAVDTVDAADAVDVVNAVDTVDAADAVDVVNAIDAVDAADAVNAIDAVDAVDVVNAIDVVDTANAIDAVDTVNAVESVNAVDGVNVLPTVESSAESVPITLPSSPDEVIPSDIQSSVISSSKSAASKYAEMIGGGPSSSSQAPPPADSDVFSAASSAVADTLETVKQGAESFATAIQKSLTSGPGALQDALASYIQSLKSLESSISSQTKIESLSLPADKSFGVPSVSLPSLPLQPLTEAVQSVTEITYSAAAISLNQLYSSFKDSLPPEVASSLSQAEDKFSTIAIPAAAFVGQALKNSLVITGKLVRATEEAVGLNPDDPALTLIPLLGGTIFLGYLYWKERYGGYSGDLSPEEALQVLRNEINSVLVDIRPQPVIELEGIVDLRRSARFKDAYVEYKKIDASFRKRIRNPTETELMIMAAKIYGLKGVGLNTQVLVLDSDGSQSKEIAKALQKYGFLRAYRVEGGFQAWASSLKVKQEAPESTLQILQQEAEAIYEEVRPTALQLSGAGLGLALGLYAIAEWEKFFELVGVIAIGQLAYNILFVYETAEEFQQDLTEFLKSVGLYSVIAPVASNLVSPSDSAATQSPRLPSEASTKEEEASDASSKAEEAADASLSPSESNGSVKSEEPPSSEPKVVSKTNGATNGATNGSTNGSLSKAATPVSAPPPAEKPKSDATLVPSSEE